MRPHNPQLAMLWLTEPDKAAATVRDAIQGTTSLDEAARIIGISRSTLFRWLKRPELKEGRVT